MRSDRKMVLVEWDDSNVTHGWLPDDAPTTEPAHCRTVGILINEGEEGMVIALAESNCGSVLETIAIPLGCVKSMRELRVK